MSACNQSVCLLCACGGWQLLHYILGRCRHCRHTCMWRYNIIRPIVLPVWFRRRSVTTGRCNTRSLIFDHPRRVWYPRLDHVILAFMMDQRMNDGHWTRCAWYFRYHRLTTCYERIEQKTNCHEHTSTSFTTSNRRYYAISVSMVILNNIISV